MALKQSGQFGFVDALMPSGVGRNDRLDKLLSLVKWYRFEKVLAKLRDEGSAGRPAYDTTYNLYLVETRLPKYFATAPDTHFKTTATWSMACQHRSPRQM